MEAGAELVGPIDPRFALRCLPSAQAPGVQRRAISRCLERSAGRSRRRRARYAAVALRRLPKERGAVRLRTAPPFSSRLAANSLDQRADQACAPRLRGIDPACRDAANDE